MLLKSFRPLSLLYSHKSFLLPSVLMKPESILNCFLNKDIRFLHFNKLYSTRISQKGSFQISIRNFKNNENDFHLIASNALELIFDRLNESDLNVPSFDIDVTGEGVLTISYPSTGTWVLNKQSPNKQLWFSSPISGPNRFSFDEKEKRWISIRDGKYLLDYIVEEISNSLNVKFQFNKKF